MCQIEMHFLDTNRYRYFARHRNHRICQLVSSGARSSVRLTSSEIRRILSLVCFTRQTSRQPKPHLLLPLLATGQSERDRRDLDGRQRRKVCYPIRSFTVSKFHGANPCSQAFQDRPHRSDRDQRLIMPVTNRHKCSGLCANQRGPIWPLGWRHDSSLRWAHHLLSKNPMAFAYYDTAG
jgi:hypothetical protein